MTLGERELEREVLTLFAQQSTDLLARLEKLPREGASLAHTLKGSARGIGAFAVAQAADDLEQRLRQGLSVTAEVAALQQAVGCCAGGDCRAAAIVLKARVATRSDPALLASMPASASCLERL